MTEITKTYDELIGHKEPLKLPFSDEDLTSKIAKSYDAIIVLDDDPTGTQTVHDIPVLTEWSKTAIGGELDRGSKLFYILTNSRSLVSEQAEKMGLEIAKNIKYSQDSRGIKCLVISRSDSTLRGHYPMEVNLMLKIFQPQSAVQFIVPAFFEGGRYSINDIHYVREGEQMIPVAETPFAKDKVFGFQSSNLKDWVIEKFKGKIDSSKLKSLAIENVENSTTEQLTARINSFNANDICIINAYDYTHLKKVVYSILSSHITPYFRSAASLIAVLAGQKPKLVDVSDMGLNKTKGGVTILGSYVPKSTEQLNYVLENRKIKSIELNITALLNGLAPSAQMIAKTVDDYIAAGEDVIIYTSRKLISSNESEKNLKIGSIISDYLTTIVSRMAISPKYIVGKGGITSSDLATKSLKIKRTIILGQIIPGVPIWNLQEESKFPGVPLIVYPGNVGDQKGLLQVIQKLNLEY